MIAPKVIVFGRSGQLARELARLDTPDRPVVCLGRDRCDLASGADPRPLIEAGAPSLVINAAGYTAVDQAEAEQDAPYALNQDAPGDLARACAALDVPFLHLSTDYVFDGSKAGPYTEEDARAPLGVYGASKAAGEDAVSDAGGRAATVRVAWLYSPFGSNFLKTMLRLAETRDEIAVVDDQVGRPTSARLVARALLDLGDRLVERDRNAEGLFHLAPHGEASWADFAEAIFDRSAARGRPASRVKRIRTADYPTAAQRPADSRLDPTKLENLLNTRFPDWREPLDGLIAELAPSQEALCA